ncbi:hypothetical protein BH11BAC1_BH11BAC1_30350 [soil metagenome]
MKCSSFANEYIYGMKKTFCLLFLGFKFYFFNTCFGQIPTIQWEHFYGGTSGEAATSVEQTSDGGYIIGGNSLSIDGDVTGHHGSLGNPDCWVVKTDSVGNIQWEKSLGGSYEEECVEIHQIRYGGYIVLVKTGSNDGDVTVNNGYDDFWIVKLDGAGNMIWQKSYGGSFLETPVAIEQTTDNGFIAAGYTSSNDSDVSGNHGQEDYWVIKIDSSGNVQWKKCYGGSLDDEAYDICQLNDGGYVVVGHSQSFDGDVLNTDSLSGCSWILKLDSIGNLITQRVFNKSPGGFPDSIKYVSNVTPTPNNGVVVAGRYHFQPGGATHDNIYAEKLDSVFTTIWDKNYYSTCQRAYCGDIQPTYDGGYVISGWNSPCLEYNILKIDNVGNQDWDTAFCCSWVGYAYTKQTSDGGYIFANQNIGTYPNYWLIKFNNNSTAINENPVLNSSLIASLNTSELRFSFSSPEYSNLRLTLYDITGRVIFTQAIHANPGLNNKIITIGDLAPGVYVFTLGGEGWSEVTKVMKANDDK